ncbi:MAG: MFS transporter [Thermoleophilia bacterium]|nr:MFS transporter [Thermoleophilia bacterium]
MPVPASPDAPSVRLPPRTGLVLLTVSAAVFIAALDQTMVVTVLPSILRTLHIPYTKLDQAAWIVTGYLLGYTVAMPLFGRLADVRGRRVMFLASVLIFVGGSVLCVLAQSLTTLVGARVIQAAGGGALVPIGMAVSADLFPPHRRAFALGIIGAAAEAGGVLGPLYGATLSHLWGWRVIFLINIPLGVALVAAGVLLIPARRVAARSDGQSIDFVGAALMAAALASLTIGLAGNTQTGEAAVRPWWLLGSVLTFVAFVLFEIRRRDPLVRLDLFRRVPFSAANLANLAVGGALIIGMVEIPLYAYSLLGKSEIAGGLLLMRLTIMIPIGALIGGWLADRIGYRMTGVLGFLLTAAGYGLTAGWPAQPSSAQMTMDLVLTGLGFGVVIAPIGATVIASAGDRWMATGSALVTVMRMVGMTVGLASLSSWGLRRFNTLMAGTSLPLRTGDMTDSQYDALAKAYEATLRDALQTVYGEFFAIAAVIALVAVVPAFFFHRRRKGERHAPLLPQ